MTNTQAGNSTNKATNNSERETAYTRRHKTYEQEHWETAHVERVDKIGVFESPPFGDGPIRSREEIRVDLDGFGHGGASLHGIDDNLQVSFWLTPERATELLVDLAENLDRVVSAEEGDR